MKKIYIYYVASVLLVSGLSSCGEDFLTITHNDIVTPDVLFLSERNVDMGLSGVYDLLIGEWGSGADDISTNWNLKPQVAFSNYPARDLQPDGWDQEFGTHSWKPDFYFFGPAWLRCYRAIDRVNLFIQNLEQFDEGKLTGGQARKNQMLGEARALRAYFYNFLIQWFGGVPMLMTGETYATHPGKSRNTAQECWDLIIEDLEFARDNLEWKPWKGQYGRVTKGMAKAYLGWAYMYQKRWTEAKKELLDIINSGEYSLNPVYAFIHIESQKWQKESIWEIAYHDWSGVGYNGPGTQNTYVDAVWRGPRMYAGLDYGGLGPSYTSFEFVWCHEPGDKRVVSNVAQYGEFNIGYPSVTLGAPGSAQIGVKNETAQPFVSTFILPNNYNMKHWRKHHGGTDYHSYPITYQRLAGVMLNYAECCFETGDMAEGWKYINLIRERAFGKLEVNATPNNVPFAVGRSLHYPLNRDPNIVVPDAETFYSTYKRTAGRNGGMVNKFMGWMKASNGTDSIIPHPTTNMNPGNRVGLYEKKYYQATTPYTPYTSPVWKVALIQERRKELFAEYEFWQDLCRMGVAKEYLDAEYPQNNIEHLTVPQTGTHDDVVQRLINTDFTGRIQTWQPNPFDPTRMLYPIPQTEMDGNPAFTKEDQNPGY